MRRRHLVHLLGANLLASLPQRAMATPGAGTASAKTVLRVMTSFSILQDLVREVGGERVQVQTLVGADDDAHTFEPRPTHLRSLLEARLLVINGLNFEPWAEKIVKSADFKGEVLVVSQGLQAPRFEANLPRGANHGYGHGHAHGIDPHAWQDPHNVAHYVQAIADTLCRLDPDGAAAYRSHAQAYLADLRQLDAWIMAQFADLHAGQLQVITSHTAFAYFAARYKVRFLAPQGISTESRPSAQAVARLIQLIRKERIRAVFLERMSDSKLLKQIARDTGITLGPALYVDALTAPGGDGDTYLKMMRHNVTALAQGMRQN